MNTIIAVFQLKHLISKTPRLEIFKMWSTIFYLQNWRRFCKIWTNFLVSNIFVNLEIQESYFMKSSSGVQPPFFYFLCHALYIRNQRRLLSRFSIPLFIVTPRRKKYFIDEMMSCFYEIISSYLLKYFITWLQGTSRPYFVSIVNIFSLYTV